MLPNLKAYCLIELELLVYYRSGILKILQYENSWPPMEIKKCYTSVHCLRARLVKRKVLLERMRVEVIINAQAKGPCFRMIDKKIHYGNI